MNNIIDFKKIDDFKILLILESGEKKILDANKIINLPFLSDVDKTIWKNLISKGNFISKLELDFGALVWKGWTEIFPEDLYKFLEEEQQMIL